MLIYFINYDLKEWFCPVLKIGEIYRSPSIMEGIIHTIRCRWNRNRVGIITSYEFEKIDKNLYKELNIKWEDY